MKKSFAVLLLVALMASSSFAAAGHWALDYQSIINGVDPTYGTTSLSTAAFLRVPIILPSQKVELVYDFTDALSVFTGVTTYQLTSGSYDIMGADKGDVANGTGAAIGVKYRLGKGILIPVVGAGAYLFSAGAQNSFPIKTFNASFLIGTFGFEYTITPGLLFIGDAVAIDMFSGYFEEASGDGGTISHLTRLFPGFTLGVRWYFL